MSELLEQVIEIAKTAGQTILEIYGSAELEIENKEDSGYVSPLTTADTAAHEVITKRLEEISDWPVISEEGSRGYPKADKFWLVDPLDGTKEFINKNGEFTVNIGLIENGRPILGVVYQPAADVIYAADSQSRTKISAEGIAELVPSTGDKSKPRLVVSRNHKGDKLEKILAGFGPHEETDVGSSLKFCWLAEGKAQAYPRLVPTYLWDTAAADAILSATGGKIRSLEGRELVYTPEKDIRNPLFIATARGCDELFDELRQAAEAHL